MRDGMPLVRRSGHKLVREVSKFDHCAAVPARQVPELIHPCRIHLPAKTRS